MQGRRDARDVLSFVRVAEEHLGRFHLVADAPHPARDRGREGEVRVRVGTRQPALHAEPRVLADRAEPARAVVAAPHDGGGCPRPELVALVRVDERRVHPRHLSGRGHQPAQVPAEGVAHVGRRVAAPHERLGTVHVPHAGVKVTRGPRLGHRPFRHEGQRHAVERGDLLRPVLVDRVVIGVRQRIGIRDVDLVLPFAELTLRELDRDPGTAHVVAHLTDEPLVLRRLQHVVIHDVGRAGSGIAVSALGQVVERILEEVELELRAGLDLIPLCGGLGDLILEDLARSDGDRLARLLVGDVAEHHRGLVDPRAPPEGREVRDHPEVPVAGLPAGVLVARERLHLHVDRQQVQTGVEPLGAQDLLDEEVREHALAHVAPLEVREHAEDGVDPIVPGQLLELLDGEHPLPLHLASSPSRARGGGRSARRPATARFPLGLLRRRCHRR